MKNFLRRVVRYCYIGVRRYETFWLCALQTPLFACALIWGSPWKDGSGHYLLHDYAVLAFECAPLRWSWKRQEEEEHYKHRFQWPLFVCRKRATFSTSAN